MKLLLKTEHCEWITVTSVTLRHRVERTSSIVSQRNVSNELL